MSTALFAGLAADAAQAAGHRLGCSARHCIPCTPPRTG